eukprot:GFYU01013225.1.p1 GENE.GFYU01013225.1~~GFYU01013225.1.p1  ORF type:complete len:468 (+),score=105.01 GFYU01013225.1:309-1712(+)
MGDSADTTDSTSPPGSSAHAWSLPRSQNSQASDSLRRSLLGVPDDVYKYATTGAVQHQRGWTPRKLGILFAVALMGFGMHFMNDSLGSIETDIKETITGVNDFKFSLLYSIPSIPSVLGAFFGGSLIDRFGTKFIAVTSTSVMTVGCIITALGGTEDSYLVMLLGRVLSGFCATVILVVQQTITAHVFDITELGRCLAVTLTFGRLGQVIVFSADGTIADDYGVSGAMWFVAMACAISALAAVVYVVLDDQPGPASSGRTIALAQVRHYPRIFWLVTAILTLLYSAIFPLMMILSDFLHTKYGYTVSQSGLIASLVSFCPLLLAPTFGYVVDMYGRRPLGALLALSSATVALGSLALTDASVSPVPFVAIIGVAFAVDPACLFSSIPIIVGTKESGSAFGVVFTFMSTCFTIFFFVSGYLKQGHTYMNMLLLLASLTATAAILCVSLLHQDKAKFGSQLSSGHPDLI